VEAVSTFHSVSEPVENHLDRLNDEGVNIPSLCKKTVAERFQIVFEMLYYPYQKEFIRDKALIRVGLKARQVGGSFGWIGGDIAIKSILRRPPYITVISATQRHSNELGAKILTNLDIFEQLVVGKLAKPLNKNQEAILIGTDASMPSTCTKIMLMSCSAQSARSFTGDAYLDELAQFEQAYKIYQAVQGQITRGYTITAVSTPFGDRGLFYELTKRHERGDWNAFRRARSQRVLSSLHVIDIYKAREQGMCDQWREPIDPEFIRSTCLDDETFQQEYLCQFISDEGAALPLPLIESCIRKELPHPDPRYAAVGKVVAEEWPTRGDCVCGIDVGRVRDRTVIVVKRLQDDHHYTVELDVMKNTDFDDQEARVLGLIEKYNCRMIAIDNNGIGMPLAERLEKKYGASMVYRCNFTVVEKNTMMTTYKAKMQRGQVHLPGLWEEHTRDLKQDLHSIRRVVTAAQNVTYEAPRDDKGHADRAWADILATMAGELRGRYSAPNRREIAGVSVESMFGM